MLRRGTRVSAAGDEMSSSLLAAPSGSGAQRGREVTPRAPGHPVLLHRGRHRAVPGRSISRHRASGTVGTAPTPAPCPPGSVGTLGTSDTEHPLFLFLLRAQTMSPVAPRLRGRHGGVTCKTGPWHRSAVPLPSPVTAWGLSPSPRGGPGCARSRVARAVCQPPGRDSRAGGQGTGGDRRCEDNCSQGSGGLGRGDNQKASEFHVPTQAAACRGARGPPAPAGTDL